MKKPCEICTPEGPKSSTMPFDNSHKHTRIAPIEFSASQVNVAKCYHLRWVVLYTKKRGW